MNNSQKTYPPRPGHPLTPTTLDLGPNQKSALTILFALSNALNNDMTWCGSTKNHGGDWFQGKGLEARKGIPHMDWAGILPTQKFLESNLATRENFVQFRPSIPKLFIIFSYIDFCILVLICKTCKNIKLFIKFKFLLYTVACL